MDNDAVTWLKLHFLPFEAKLRNQLARICPDPAEVDDVIQETYCRVLQAPSLEHIREPRAFIMQAAKNIITDRLRREAIVSIQAMASLEELGVEDGGPTPERVAAARAELDWVLRLAARLPERCRKVFRARRLHGLSQKETSESLGITVSVVEYETIRAMDLMAGMVAGRGGETAPPEHETQRRKPKQARNDMLTIEQQANRWVVREKNGALDDGERAALDAWCGADVRHRGAYARALAIHAALEDAAAGTPESTPVPAPASDAPRRPARRAALWYGAMAASLAVAVGAGVFMAQPRPVTYATVTGEFRKVPLGDQSVAHINSGSQLIVTLSERERHVELVRGEAWFDVAKDRSRPFVVAAGDARARAVGTSFSVAKGPQGADILVTEGTVEVWRQDSAAGTVVLTAGETARVPAGTGTVTVARQPEEIARKLAWRDGRLVFRNQTLTAALAEFNRYSRKPIVIADRALAERTLVGRYKIDDPELFAREVAAYLRVPVSVTHERIILGNVRLLDGAREPGNNTPADTHNN